MAKSEPNKNLYIYKLPYQELFLHSWLDRLELSFNAYTFPEFSGHLGEHWTTLFYLWWVGYPFIYQVSSFKNYSFCVNLKYNYKWEVFDCMTIVMGNKTKNSPVKNKIIIQGKFFRAAQIDDFGFNTQHILTFLKEHFLDIKVLSFDYCMDIAVPVEHTDFLSTIYFEAYEVRSTGHTHFKTVANDGDIESIYDWKKDYHDNDTLFGRYYDKKKDILTKGTQYLYMNYLDNPKNIYRFELEFRRVSCQQLDFITDIMDSKKLFNIFLTKLESKGILIFSGVFDFQKTLIKRENKHENKLKWGDMYKLDTLGKVRQAKSVLSQLNKMENIGIDIMSFKEHTEDLDILKAQEYSFYYMGMLDGITEFFLGAEKVLYRDFQKEIEAHIEYVETTMGIPFEQFIKYVKGYVDENLENMKQYLSRPIYCLIYIYYVLKIFPPDDKVGKFLELFQSQKIINFVLKDIEKEINQIKKSRTYSVLYQNTTDKDPETAMKLTNYLMKKF